MNLQAYEVEYGDMYWETYRGITPTGRWRICTGPYYKEPMMEIEVKGRLWNRWVPECRIAFRPAETVTTFECGSTA